MARPLKAFGEAMSRAITPAVLQARAEDFPAALLEWCRAGDSKKLAAWLRSGRLTEENLEDLALPMVAHQICFAEFLP